MKRSLRQTLAESHIAAVTIALLLFWSLNNFFYALLSQLPGAIEFLVTAVAIRGIPYSARTFTSADRLELMLIGHYLYLALAGFFAASLLSHWVYGAGPLRSLFRYRKPNGGKYV